MARRVVDIVNNSDYLVKDLRRLTNRVLASLRKSFTMPPIGTVVVSSYDSNKWEGGSEGDTITIRIGRKINFPCKWDRKGTDLPTWEDLYVGLLTWCLMLQFQKMVWSRRTTQEREGRKKYSRSDCQHVSTRMIQRWRVESEMKMIYEKAGVYAD